MIPFNKPYLSGRETEYISRAVASGKISGNGIFSQKCHTFFEKRYGFKRCLLTTSCTDALEMCALLLDIKPGDEVILPSYTFVSAANAFLMRGARLVFADSRPDNPNMDIEQLEPLITSRTRVIAVMHYAGVACDMGKVRALAQKYELEVIEDAAQAVDSYYRDEPLGGIGALGTFSFHETKNIISGEGGMLVINDDRYIERAEILWEKGTNRAAFFRGEVDKYNWVDVGSSFLPSEVTAAFLFAQLENLEKIQGKRKMLWNRYYESLSSLEEKGKLRLPDLPDYATNNGHLFYLVCQDLEERTALIAHLRRRNIHAVFHYIPLHSSPFFKDKHDDRELPNCERYGNCLLRLPLFWELSEQAQKKIIDEIYQFYTTKKAGS